MFDGVESVGICVDSYYVMVIYLNQSSHECQLLRIQDQFSGNKKNEALK
jgi:hypothetical protein